MAINTRYLDRRTCDRYMEKGIVKSTDFAAHLKALPDETSNAQWIEMDLHDAEMGDGDLESGSDDKGTP